MARKSLYAVLSNKATALYNKSDVEAAAAQNFIAASAKAQENAQTAAKHAAAVDKAVAILEEAGVAL